MQTFEMIDYQEKVYEEAELVGKDLVRIFDTKFDVYYYVILCNNSCYHI